MRSFYWGKGQYCLLMLFAGLATPALQASVLPSGVDIWFSTSVPAIGLSGAPKYLAPGAILSTSGKVVATNAKLLSAFQPRFSMPKDRGLDAMAILGTAADPTIVFSTNRGFYSNALQRTIGDGDLVTNKGQVLASNQDLLAAFDPKGSNFGLDAVFINNLDGGAGPEYWFSTTRSFYSRALGDWISSGDVVSNRGQVVARSSDLLSAFQPRGNTSSIGIDSLYVSQEAAGQAFWFSTTKDFYSNSLKRWIRANDLISSDGTVLMTQKDFMKKFGFVIPICGSMRLDATALSTPTNPPERPQPRTPEPATLGLLLIGGLLGLRRRRA